MKDRYFSHDANARVDPKLVKIRRAYGMEGYGIYFALLEMMFGEPGYALPYNDDQFDAIAYDLHTEVNIGAFVVDCVNVGLFETDHDAFWSPSFRRRMTEIEEKAAERSRRASHAVSIRWMRQHRESAEQDEKPPEPPSSLPENGEADDPEWDRFAREYETQLGSLPHGNQLQRLMSYFDDMGADVLIEAVKAANGAEPEKPASFLLAILKEWAEAGVDSVSKAKAQIIDHDRKTKARGKSQPEQSQEPKIRFVY